MGKMYRITFSEMLVLLRLVIIVSLAGYSLPTASAAMHGSWAGSEVLQSHDHHGQVDDHHEAAAGHEEGEPVERLDRGWRRSHPPTVGR